jgi:uncharacterized protein DUF6805
MSMAIDGEITNRRCLLRLLSCTAVAWLGSGFAQRIAPAGSASELDDVTIGLLDAVGGPAERRFHLAGASSIVTLGGRSGRRSGSWFSYDLPVDRSNAVAVVVTYNTLNEQLCRFAVSVEGEGVAEEFIPPREAARFYDVHYGVPSGLATGKDAITVRFDAVDGYEIAPVFAIRTVRA